MYFKIDLCKTLMYRAKFHNTFLNKEAAEDTFAYKEQSCRCVSVLSKSGGSFFWESFKTFVKT